MTGQLFGALGSGLMGAAAQQQAARNAQYQAQLQYLSSQNQMANALNDYAGLTRNAGILSGALSQSQSFSYHQGLAMQNYRSSYAVTGIGPAYDRGKQRERRTGWRRFWRTAAIVSVRMSRGSSVLVPMTLSEARAFNVICGALIAAYAVLAILL